ncbi:hypothetical protein, partial [Streptomyces sp. NPDC005538]
MTGEVRYLSPTLQNVLLPAADEIVYIAPSAYALLPVGIYVGIYASVTLKAPTQPRDMDSVGPAIPHPSLTRLAS